MNSVSSDSAAAWRYSFILKQS